MLGDLAKLPSRLGSLTQNALEVARFGGLETDDEPFPFEVTDEGGIHRLRRYFPHKPNDGPAVLLVPPSLLSAELWDISPRASAVRDLYDAGIDPWVLDFGSPAHEEGGMERDLADHVLAVSDAVERIHEHTGRKAHISGYSQGGMFCYQAAAYRRSDKVASLVTFGSPVDTRKMMPAGLPEELAARGFAEFMGAVGRRAAVPPWAPRYGFRLMDPVKTVRQQVGFLAQLHDRESLLPRERQRRFLGDGWVAWPGPAVVDFAQQFMAQNRLLSGGMVIDDRTLSLADLTCPVLIVMGEFDGIAPAASVRPLVRAAPNADVRERVVPAGHLSIVVGSTARSQTWPSVVAWTRHLEEGEPLPEDVVPVSEHGGGGRGPGRVRYALELLTDVSAGAARNASSGATRTVSTVRGIAEEAVGQLPQLARIGQMRPGTRVSLSGLVARDAKRDPDRIQFIFEDRAHTRAAANARIDAVVRGLIATGVRRGEHVGVLMSARPSALVIVAAVNRLGAVAVMLRPGGPVSREASLGSIRRIVCEPEGIAEARAANVPIFVLGGGGDERALPADVTDMERIDPDEVELPDWYRPDPGRARDLAFILFTGEGERLRVNRITNRRWMVSARGTAAAAALTRDDTVYCVTPPSHPSGLLVAIGGAIAGGARFALARGYEPETFWEEIRRYGGTVAVYTWTMLRALVEAAPTALEDGSPLRLFVGSGMPPALWRQVLDRFPSVRVVEFYTVSDSEAVLVNLGGSKVGSQGRKLPGAARVRLVHFDTATGQLELDGRGFAKPCRTGETGVLLAEVDPSDAARGIVAAARGVFAPDDAWVVTGDLFVRDEDGDLWLLDAAAGLIHTEDGVRAPNAIRDALETLPAVQEAVVYGFRPDPAVAPLAVAAVRRRRRHKLKAEDLDALFQARDDEARPDVVRLVDEIERTPWYRPVAGALPAQGLPTSSARRPAWCYDAEARRFRALSPERRKRLTPP